MQIQQLNYNDAEKVYGAFTNVSGETITAGSAFCWDISSEENADGNRAVKPSTAGLSCIAGVAIQTVANNKVFLGQIYGHAFALTINDTVVDIAAGDILKPVDGQWYFAWSSVGDGVSGLVMAAQPYGSGATPAALSRQVFLRLM